MKKTHRIVSILLIVGTFFIVAAVTGSMGCSGMVGDAQKVKRFPIKNQPRHETKGVHQHRAEKGQYSIQLANTGLPERTISIGKAVLQG